MQTIQVEWVPGNGQWCVVGGGLPPGACWAAFDSREDAVAEARATADDIGVDYVEVTK